MATTTTSITTTIIVIITTIIASFVTYNFNHWEYFSRSSWAVVRFKELFKN